MTIGARVREIRISKKLTLRELAAKVGVNFTYLSKIENHRLEVGHSPSASLIHKLAVELDCDEEELLLLAEKVPEQIRKRVCERPEVFRLVADMDDDELDEILERYGS